MQVRCRQHPHVCTRGVQACAQLVPVIEITLHKGCRYASQKIFARSFELVANAWWTVTSSAMRARRNMARKPPADTILPAVLQALHPKQAHLMSCKGRGQINPPPFLLQPAGVTVGDATKGGQGNSAAKVVQQSVVREERACPAQSKLLVSPFLILPCAEQRMSHVHMLL